MPGLDSYLVTLGVKGQDVVLATMNKIRKKGGDLQKKKVVISAASNVGAAKKQKTPADVAKTEGVQTKNGDKDKKKSDKENETTKKFAKSVDKFSDTSARLSHGVSRLDPTAAINTGLGALAKMSIVGIPFAIAEAAMNMATNTISMAKSNASAQYGIMQRNATAQYYGGNISFDKDLSPADKKQIAEQNDLIKKYSRKRDSSRNKDNQEMFQNKINRAESRKASIQYKNSSKWSNEEMAALRTSLGASFGRIQQPLASALAEFTQGTSKYDARAVTRVASGNWRSTGTDRGWMVQQIFDSLGDVPPSIAQRFQASLLNQFGKEEIQQAPKEEQRAQRANAMWNKTDERQVSQVFDAVNENINDLFELNNKLNSLQADMVQAGAGVASALNFVANQISSAANKIKAGK